MVLVWPSVMGEGSGDRPLSVVVVDDEADLRLLLRLSIDGREGFRVVAEGGSGPEAVELARRHQPDVLLADLSMPGMTVDTISEVLSHSPRTRVVILSGHDSAGAEGPMLARGASAYLEKGVALAQVLSAMKRVVAPNGRA